jgi:hypothetical protein
MYKRKKESNRKQLMAKIRNLLKELSAEASKNKKKRQNKTLLIIYQFGLWV